MPTSDETRTDLADADTLWKSADALRGQVDASAGDDEPGLRGIEGDLGPEHADTFRRDLHKDLKADYMLANPPFNDSDWHRSDEDVRWKYGLPPKGNANFAWVQHFIHHLSPSGFVGFVLANGSIFFNQSNNGDIVPRMRTAWLENTSPNNCNRERSHAQ